MKKSRILSFLLGTFDVRDYTFVFVGNAGGENVDLCTETVLKKTFKEPRNRF